jgi:hypothetical protein
MWTVMIFFLNLQNHKGKFFIKTGIGKNFYTNDYFTKKLHFHIINILKCINDGFKRPFTENNSYLLDDFEAKITKKRPK